MIFYYYYYNIRITDAYHSKRKYRTKHFIKTMYYNYKQVENKPKW